MKKKYKELINMGVPFTWGFLFARLPKDWFLIFPLIVLTIVMAKNFVEAVE